jgi:hypothetical protein
MIDTDYIHPLRGASGERSSEWVTVNLYNYIYIIYLYSNYNTLIINKL